MANQDIPIEMMHIDGKKNPSDFLSRERSEENDANSHDLADMDLSDALDSYLVQVIQEYENLSPIKIFCIVKVKIQCELENISKAYEKSSLVLFFINM